MVQCLFHFFFSKNYAHFEEEIVYLNTYYKPKFSMSVLKYLCNSNSPYQLLFLKTSLVLFPSYHIYHTWNLVIQCMYSHRYYGATEIFQMIWFNILIVKMKTLWARKLEWFTQHTQLTSSYLTSKSFFFLLLCNTIRLSVIRDKILTTQVVKRGFITVVLCNIFTNLAGDHHSHLIRFPLSL
jgi:hypothetical protein